MKTTTPFPPAPSLWKRLALISTVCALALNAGSLSAATISSGFEPTTNGTYTAGGDVIGKQDTSLGGTWTSIWATPPSGVIFSSPTGQAGSTSLRIASDGTVRGANLQVTNAASLLTSTFSFSLAMNVQSLGTPNSGQQVQVQFGAQTFGSGSSWLKFGYDGASSGNQYYYIQGWNGSAITARNVLASNVTAGLGEWATFNFTIDPFSHTYTSATITGSKGTVAFDLTGLQIAWDGSTTPASYLSLVTGSGDVVTVDFDNVAISSIPEPAVAGLLLGGLLFGLVRRRRHPRV